MVVVFQVNGDRPFGVEEDFVVLPQRHVFVVRDRGADRHDAAGDRRDFRRVGQGDAAAGLALGFVFADQHPQADWLDVLEDFFLRLGEISSATEVAQASAIALRITLDLVPAGAGATLIRTRAGNGLRFRAASGPAASKLIDTVIPLDRGIAGYVCQLGVGLSIADVRRDRRHDTRVDRSTGFDTRTLLAVPVRPDTGGVYGCIELLNPPRPFTDADLEVAARVGASLGTFLNSVYTVR